ncbi:hypothetical protein EAI_03037, partial [Harpegnathos saltator]
LGWDVLLLLTYSPDIASLDYYLFRSLQNFLNGETFISLEDYKNYLQQFLH